jgi:hypothetical protein
MRHGLASLGDAYETAARERWRALPWRERHSLRGFAVLALIAVAVAAFFWAKLQ